MKVAIIGTRSPSIGYDKWKHLLLDHITIDQIGTIISRGARGVDYYAKQFADNHNIPFVEIIPDFAKHGRDALEIRNSEVFEQADIVFAFQQNGDAGTYHTLKTAYQMNKPVIIINMTTIKLINGQELLLSDHNESTVPYTDLDNFIANVHNIIANEELIFSDSRIFMCPIDMNCHLTIIGKFEPTTLGAYLEWWLNYKEASDPDGNPLVRLTGSSVCDGNSCISANIDGKRRNITLLSGFSEAYKSFLRVQERYKEHIGNCEAYSFERVLQLFKEMGASQEISDLKNTNAQLSAKLEQIRRKHIALEKLYEEKTDEYLAAILEPYIEEAKRLYSSYREIEEWSDSLVHEHYAAKRLACQRLRDGEITQKEYVAIRNREFDRIHEIRDKQNAFWLEHFTALYHKNAKYFTPKSIGRFLDKK